ncbi:signal peptidase I [Candidatus Dependentiae bacterium]|nr:signal peptidase I [Candidatus Dependentiae bacterium]
MSYSRRILGRYYDVQAIRVIFELIVIVSAAFAIRTFLFGLYQVPTGSMETTLLVGERFVADKLTYWFKAPQRGDIIAFDAPMYKYSTNPAVNIWERYASWKVDNWTKRLIGIPGDHVQGKIEDGKPVVYLNNKKLDESAYLNKYPLIYVQKKSTSIRPSDQVPVSIDLSIKEWNKQPFYKINPADILGINNFGQIGLILRPETPTERLDIFDVTLGKNQYWAMGDNRKGSLDSRAWGALDGKLIHGKIIFRLWSIDSDESWWIFDLIKNPLEFWKKVRWNRCLQWVK